MAQRERGDWVQRGRPFQKRATNFGRRWGIRNSLTRGVYGSRINIENTGKGLGGQD